MMASLFTSKYIYVMHAQIYIYICKYTRRKRAIKGGKWGDSAKRFFGRGKIARPSCAWRTRPNELRGIHTRANKTKNIYKFGLEYYVWMFLFWLFFACVLPDLIFRVGLLILPAFLAHGLLTAMSKVYACLNSTFPGAIICNAYRLIDGPTFFLSRCCCPIICIL